MTQQPLWAPPPPRANVEVVPELDLLAPGAQRRWTILLRWLLAVPHYIVLSVLGTIGIFVVVAGWFAALVVGRLPGALADYLAGLLIYQTRVHAYTMLLVDRYPPFAFDAPGYPVQVDVRPAELNRLAVLFRLILMIPAAIVLSVVMSGWSVLCLFFWLIALVLGRLPEPVFGASTATARFAMRVSAYIWMLTAAYPKRLFGDESLAPVERRSASRPLLLSGGAKVLLVAFIVLGLADAGWSSAIRWAGNGSTDAGRATGTATSTAGPIR